MSVARQQFGITFLELMIVLIIVAVLALIGVPGFQTAVQNNRITAATNDLIASLQQARMAAIKHAQTATVCASQAPNATVPQCDNSGNGWEQGWIVFTDANDNNQYDGGDDTLLRVHQRLNKDPDEIAITMRGNGNVAKKRITYQPSGRGTSGSIVICDQRGFDPAKVVVISSMGRARSFTGPQARDTANISPANCRT